MTTIIEAFNESCRQVALQIIVSPIVDHVNLCLAEGRQEPFTVEELAQVLSFPPSNSSVAAVTQRMTTQRSAPRSAPVESPAPSPSPALSPGSGCIRVQTRGKAENINKVCGQPRQAPYEYCARCLNLKEVQRILEGKTAKTAKTAATAAGAKATAQSLGSPPKEHVFSAKPYRDGLGLMPPHNYIVKSVEEQGEIKIVCVGRLAGSDEVPLTKEDKIRLIADSIIPSDELFSQPDKPPCQEYEEEKLSAQVQAQAAASQSPTSASTQAKPAASQSPTSASTQAKPAASQSPTSASTQAQPAATQTPVPQLPTFGAQHKAAVDLARPTASISRPAGSLAQNTILGSSMAKRIPEIPFVRK